MLRSGWDSRRETTSVSSVPSGRSTHAGLDAAALKRWKANHGVLLQRVETTVPTGLTSTYWSTMTEKAKHCGNCPRRESRTRSTTSEPALPGLAGRIAALEFDCFP